MKMWKNPAGCTEPVEVECPKGGYPAYDADGEQCFVNSHWKTLGEAWQALKSSRRLRFESQAECVRFARSTLATQEQHLVDAALVTEEVDRKHAVWEESQSHKK